MNNNLCIMSIYTIDFSCFLVYYIVYKTFKGDVNMSNIWHDISPKRINTDDFICVVEISKGSKKKYELDKEFGQA